MAVLISQIYVACGAMSFLSCALVLICYLGTPSLSRFPSSMLGWRLVFDAALSAAFVMLHVRQLHLLQGADDGVPFGTGAADADSACSPGLAFLAQFGLFGSLSWFACLSIDLYLSVTRPFTRPSSRFGAYQLWVWAGATVTGLVAAMRPGYDTVYHLCWMVDDPSSPSSETTALRTLSSTWSLFFAWLILYSLLSVAALIYAHSKLLMGGESLRRRLLPRIAHLNASRLYTGGRPPARACAFPARHPPARSRRPRSQS